MLCAHLGYQFTERPFLERFEAAAKAGFRYVEFPDPYDYAPEVLKAQLTKYNLTLVQFAASIGSDGEKGLAALPGREKDFRNGLDVALRYAKELNCELIHPMAGIISADITFEECWETYVDNIKYAIDFFAFHQIKLLIEVMSSKVMEGYFMDSFKLFHSLIEEVGDNRCKLIFDTYHVYQNESEILFSFRDLFSYVAHVQVSDYPGRHEPGTGVLPFDEFFDYLWNSGYCGKVGCEYKPLHSTAEGVIKFQQRYKDKVTF